jgi:acetyltransferase-like isoleucine patch superfamily enzyme
MAQTDKPGTRMAQTAKDREVRNPETVLPASALVRGASLIGRIRRALIALLNQLRWRWRFDNFGWPSVLSAPDLITHPKQIRIGRHVEIRKGARIEAVGGDVKATPKIVIGDGTSIHMYFHCGAASLVEIGSNVLIAGRVYVTDHDHDLGQPGNPARLNRSLITSPTIIEDDCWLGEGCMVLKGVRLGKGCVVGAGAVVSRDVPPYTVVAGIPARALKHYDLERKCWVSVPKEKP